MKEFTHEEIEGIVEAMSQRPTVEEKAKIPLLPPGSYHKIAKLGFSPLLGEQPRPIEDLHELGSLEVLRAKVEVVFGKTTMTLKELAALEKGALLPLDELCDDLVEIFVNGMKIGRGEIVVVDGHFGVKIVSFTKN